MGTKDVVEGDLGHICIFQQRAPFQKDHHAGIVAQGRKHFAPR